VAQSCLSRTSRIHVVPRPIQRRWRGARNTGRGGRRIHSPKLDSRGPRCFVVRRSRHWDYPVSTPERQFQGRSIASINQSRRTQPRGAECIVPHEGGRNGRYASSYAKVAALLADDVRLPDRDHRSRAFLRSPQRPRWSTINHRAPSTARHPTISRTRVSLVAAWQPVDHVRAEQEMVSDQARVESAHIGLARAREALGVLLCVRDARTSPTTQPRVAPAITNALADATTTGPRTQTSEGYAWTQRTR